MENTQKYFSLVKDRISELQEELRIAQEKQASSKSHQSIQRYQLEADFITRKISHLSKLVDLPMLMLISNLTEEQIQKLQQEHKIPQGESADYLIKTLGLEKLNAYIKQPKVVTLFHIKDAFINDFDAMAELLAMNQTNLQLTNHRNRLYGIGLNGEFTYLQLSHDEKNLNLESAKVEKLVNKALEDFNFESLKEISMLIENSNQRLSIDFILKHSDKVLSSNPDMKKAIKRLARRRKFKWLDRFLPAKRSKSENAFLNAIMDYYHNSSVLDDLGITADNLFHQSDEEINDLVALVQRKCKIRKAQIANRREHISISKKETLRQVRGFEAEQQRIKQNFVSLVNEKITYFPKGFQDQLWNEPDLKDSCMREACYLEEKKLIEQLTKQIKPTSLAVEKKGTDSQAKRKKLVA